MTETGAELLSQAREAMARRDWRTAREKFQLARARGPLPADDLYALGDAARWLGLVDEGLESMAEAYHRFVELGEPLKAAMAALAIAYGLSLRGDEAMASGWIGRGLSLLEKEPESVEHAYLIYLDIEAALTESDMEAAVNRARELRERARHFQNPTLMALAAAGEGRALLRTGKVKEGMALLDEAMLAAVREELDSGWAGMIYCHMMDACHELMDIRRAGEWTEATVRWCESMPGAGPYMGICRVHRAQLLEVRGAWDQAERESLRVCEDMRHFHVGVTAEAHYEIGQILRLRGDLQGADAAFARAHELGRDPQPGLALLRLAQGRTESATAAIRAALAKEARNPLARARLCFAQVEIALASADLEAAEQATVELEETAALYRSSGLKAAASTARGAVFLARERFADALQALGEALLCWNDINAPYEVARIRCLLSRAYEGLGDRETAERELNAANQTLANLGAPPTGQAAPASGPSLPGGLTRREYEVLRLATRGMSNGEIADALVLSVRTVERHLATIYQKLGVQGRNARAATVSLALRERLVADETPGVTGAT